MLKFNVESSIQVEGAHTNAQAIGAIFSILSALVFQAGGSIELLENEAFFSGPIVLRVQRDIDAGTIIVSADTKGSYH